MRGLILVVALTAAACSSSSTPTAPAPIPAAGVPTSLTLSVDRQMIPYTDVGGAVLASVTVGVQPGTNREGVPVQFVMTMSNGAVTSDIATTNAEGRATRQFNFSSAGTIAVSAGGFSTSAVITRQAAPVPAEPPPPSIPPTSPPPTSQPFVTLSVAAETYAPSVGSPFSVTVTATMSDGSSPSDWLFDFDTNGDGTIDIRGDQPSRSPYVTRLPAFTTTGAKTIKVRAARQSTPQIEGRADLLVTVTPGG